MANYLALLLFVKILCIAFMIFSIFAILAVLLEITVLSSPVFISEDPASISEPLYFETGHALKRMQIWRGDKE